MSESLLLWSELALLLLLLWSELALLLRPEAATGSLESLIIVHKQVARPLALRPPRPLRSVAKVLSSKKVWDLVLLSESKIVGIEVVLSLELPHSSLSLSKLTLTLVLFVAWSLHVIERGHYVDCLRPAGQPHSVVTSPVTPGIEDTEVSVSL